jgi:sugar lactone lactonase YvrE
MRNTALSLIRRNLFMPLIVVASLAVVGPVDAQSPRDVTIGDTMVMPESVTSSKDGSIFFGSTSKGNVYRATPGAATAEVWIQAAATGLTNVLGVLADDKANILWVCTNPTGGRGTPASGQTALRAFDLMSGAPKGTWPFPNGGLCNDIAIAADGTAYATDTNGRRVLRLKPGSAGLDVWVADPQLNGVDGIAVLNGSVYMNLFFSGKLFRSTVQPDGTAGPLTEIESSMPFTRPDGLRTTDSNKLLQAEGGGRLTEITINDKRGEVRVLGEGFTGATAVTQIGASAFVLVERLRVVAVPLAVR